MIAIDTASLVRMADEMGKTFGHPKGFFRAIVTWFRKESRLVFKSSGSRIGSSWKPLSEQYGKWKRLNSDSKKPGQINFMTGSLYSVMTGASSYTGARGGGQVVRVGRKKLIIGIPGLKSAAKYYHAVFAQRPLAAATSGQMADLEKLNQKKIERYKERIAKAAREKR